MYHHLVSTILTFLLTHKYIYKQQNKYKLTQLTLKAHLLKRNYEEKKHKRKQKKIEMNTHKINKVTAKLEASKTQLSDTIKAIMYTVNVKRYK